MTEVEKKIERAGAQKFVNSVFERVAMRYDLMNDIMSGGVHRLWKDAAINWLAPSRSSPALLLDVAGGTGDIATRFLKAAGRGSRAIVCDISAEMMAEGSRKSAPFGMGADLAFLQGNAECLPVASRSVNYYTIAFGIRNVPSISTALTEAFRVLKPGGRFMCLEFSHVTMPVLDGLYARYSDRAVPRLGKLIVGDEEPYRYLVESIAKFPRQTDFASMIVHAGFSRVQFRNLSGGIAALHSGIKS